MCGITGFVEKQRGAVENEHLLLSSLLNSIAHRGPDESVESYTAECGLGMRRLSIIDLTPGMYPFISNDGKRKLIFNGEIYNFTELKNELKTMGHSFKTNCDGEVILVGYEQWGDGVFSKLRGMFAVAIWDDSKKKLTLVRDRIGIKPVYYVDNPDVFLFSSEAKSFYGLDTKYFAKNLNYNNIKTLLGFMFLPDSHETVVQGIKKLPPATVLTVENGKVALQKYWALEDTREDQSITFGDAVEKLDQLLSETVKMHLMSDVPLGILLSGGLDSGLMSAMITKTAGGNAIETFTAKFNHKSNESALAETTSKYLGTRHTEFVIDVSDVNKNMEKHVSLFDDLTTFDGGIITTRLLCEQVRNRGIKVLLLGEGADEVFGGYSWFGLSQLPFSLLPGFTRNALYYYAISRNVAVNPLYYINRWNKSLTNDSPDVLRDITRRELEIQLPNHLLMKVDKGSMSQSIEARVPYLDHKIVEFAYSLPKKYKWNGTFYSHKASNEKYILRQVAKKYLPVEVATRKKKGFLLPMDDVLKSDMRKVRDYVLRKDAVSRNVFSAKTLENLFNKSESGVINTQNEYFLWRLFVLEVWAKVNNLK